MSEQLLRRELQAAREREEGYRELRSAESERRFLALLKNVELLSVIADASGRI